MKHPQDQIIRCASCGTWLINEKSRCGTCHSQAIRNSGQDWSEQALCRTIDPDLWFPDEKERAKQIVIDTCNSCPVRLNCLQVGLHETHGIWAGYRPSQRAELRRRVVRHKPSVRDAIVEQAASLGAEKYLNRNNNEETH